MSEDRIRDAYGVSLALVVGSVVVSISIADDTIGALVAGLLQLAALLAVLQVTQARPRVITIARVVGIVAALGAALLTAFPSNFLSPLVPALWGIIVLSVALAILRHLATYESINVQAVLGLVTVYLLVGLVFAYAFMFADAMGGTFFVSGDKEPASFVYFSYVTLATVGYGDLAAVPGPPRALAVLEGVFGQLYLVTVVALAVGRIGLKRE